jgi:hypothetical protein
MEGGTDRRKKGGREGRKGRKDLHACNVLILKRAGSSPGLKEGRKEGRKERKDGRKGRKERKE